jgi:hypothetical protein
VHSSLLSSRRQADGGDHSRHLQDIKNGTIQAVDISVKAKRR